MRTETFESCAVEGFLMVRMCYAYEQLCSFLKRFSVEIDSAEFSHDVMYVRSSGYDSATFYDHRCDLAASLVRA